MSTPAAPEQPSTVHEFMIADVDLAVRAIAYVKANARPLCSCGKWPEAHPVTESSQEPHLLIVEFHCFSCGSSSFVGFTPGVLAAVALALVER